LEEGGVGYEDVADKVSRAYDIAAGLPLAYRGGLALGLSRAISRAQKLSGELRSALAQLSLVEGKDWELAKLLPAALRRSDRLARLAARTFDRTVTRGPRNLAVLDARCMEILAIVGRARERSRDLLAGRSVTDVRQLYMENDALSFFVVKAIVRLMPLVYQGRYFDELIAELVDQPTSKDRLLYAGRIAARVMVLRKSLRSDTPGLLLATQTEDPHSDDVVDSYFSGLVGVGSVPPVAATLPKSRASNKGLA
jgi:hypothetical protein